MTHITVKLTPKELDLLRSLASDQLFRREFIDPRLPGHRANPGEIGMAKQLIERLRKATERHAV
jgi:DNA-binding response OmpR family regulator